MFTQTQQQQIQDALSNHSIDGEVIFAHITFQGERYNKVLIEVPITDTDEIDNALCGIFNKRGAWAVLDAVGSSGAGTMFLNKKIELAQANSRLSRSERAELLTELQADLRQYDEVNHFAFKRDGEWFARYEVYPDPARFQEQAEAVQAAPVPETNWSIDRSQVVQFALNMIGQGKTAVEAVKNAVGRYYQGYSKIVAARMLQKSVRLQGEVLEGFELGFTFSEVAELFSLSLNRLRGLVAGYLPMKTNLKAT